MSLELSRAGEKRWNKFMRDAHAHGGFRHSDEETRALRVKRARGDMWYFAREYFPQFFACESARFHKEWARIAVESSDEVAQVMAFRGSGKSTFFTLVSAAHAVVFGYRKYLLFASYTAEKSALHVMRLLAELEHNARIVADFGEPKRGVKGEHHWSELVYEQHSVMLQGLSIGQDPRGLVYGAHRPDFARLDDVQEDKKARKEQFVKDTCDWVVAKLLPAMSRGYSCVILSTPLNERCVAMSLEKGLHTPAVKTYRYAAQVRGRSAWRARYSESDLEKLRATVGSLVFEQEYNLIPRRNEDAVFRVGDIARGSYEAAVGQFEHVVSWTDPSAKQNTRGKTGRDYKATVVVGVRGAELYVLDARVRNESVGAMIGGMYTLYKRWHMSVMYWEDNGGQALLGEIFKNAASERALSLPLKSATNTLNKEQRIEQSLSARIENGVVRFPHAYKNSEDMRLVVEQLLQFPDGAHDDGIDALEGAVRMCVQWQRKQRSGVPLSGTARESERVLVGFV